MFLNRLRAVALSLVAAGGLSACSYDGYGYSGLDVGYGVSGGYHDSGYYGSSYYGGYPTYGWYDGFYYPGSGYYVYDRGGRRHRWNDNHRRYWEGRAYAIRDREDRRDFREFRRDSREDRREFRRERRDDRRAYREGAVTREQFRNDRRADRQAYRQERRADRREFRQDLRDRGGQRGSITSGRTLSPRGVGPRGQQRRNPR